MDERILKMFELLIYSIGIQNFPVEEKLKFYELSDGYFFANDEETMTYKSVVDMLAKEEMEREARNKEKECYTKSKFDNKEGVDTVVARMIDGERDFKRRNDL